MSASQFLPLPASENCPSQMFYRKELGAVDRGKVAPEVFHVDDVARITPTNTGYLSIYRCNCLEFAST